MQRFVLLPEEEYQSLLKFKKKAMETDQSGKPQLKHTLGAGKPADTIDPVFVPPPGIPAISVDDRHREDWAGYWQKS